MATTVESNIKATGGDFATIELWQASLGNLVTDDEIQVGLLFDEAYVEDVVWSGATTDATHRVILKPAPGEQSVVRGAVGSGPRVHGVIFISPIVFEVFDDFHTFQDFEITQNNQAGGVSQSAACIRDNGNVEGTHIIGMVIWKPPPTTSRSSGFELSGCSNVVIANNFIFDIDSGSGAASGFGTTTVAAVAGTSYVINNSCWNSNDRGLSHNGATGQTLISRNNIAIDAAGDDLRYGGGVGTITDKNMSGDLTADDNGDGTHFLSESAAAIFVSVSGTRDLHLQTGTNAIGNGVDQGTVPVDVEIDIDGFDRDLTAVVWDLGADQQGKDATDNEPPSGTINLEPVGNSLGEIASGVAGIDTGTLGLNPTGDTLGTTASGTPAINVEQVIQVFPIGSTLGTLASGIPVIQISTAPTDVSPVGNTIGTIEDNDNVDILHDLQFIFLEEGSSLGTIRSGITQVIGTEANVSLPVLGDTLAPLESGVVLLTLPSVGNIALPVTPGSSFLTIVGNAPTTFQIDTDNPSTPPPTPPGSTFGQILGDGIPVIQIIDTGIDEFPVGSSLGTIASGQTKTTASFPTAPPGTAGGRLIIRSITRNVTRPVTHDTDLEVRVFNA